RGFPAPSRPMKLKLAIVGVLVLLASGIVGYFLIVGRERAPSTFDPDEVEVTEYCKPDDDGVWPEGIGDIEHGSTDDYGWAEGGGCIHRPIREAWASLFDIPNLVRDGVDRHAFHLLPPEDPFSHRFRIDYEIDDV